MNASFHVCHFASQWHNLSFIYPENKIAFLVCVKPELRNAKAERMKSNEETQIKPCKILYLYMKFVFKCNFCKQLIMSTNAE